VLKKLVSHTFIYGLASQISKVAGVLALPIITKDLTEKDFGIYGVIMAYGAAIEILSTLGLRVSFMNTYYQKEARFRIFWAHLYGFLFSWRIVYSVIHFALIYLILPDDVSNKVLTSALAVGASLFFGPVSLIGSLYYQLREKPVVVGTLSAIGGITTVLLNVFFISYLKLGYLGWFWSTFITGAIVNGIYLVLVSVEIKLKPRLLFNLKYLKRSLGVALPTIPHFYSMFLLNSSDRIILNQFGVSTGNIGKYNISYTVGNIFQSIAMASGFAITPLMMRCYQLQDETTARKLVFFLQGIFLFATFLSCLWMREIFILLVQNESLNKMYYLSIVIVMAFNYRPIYYGAINKLIYLEKTKILWRLTFIPGIVNVALNFIFIPFWGWEFAAISTFITFTLMGILGYFQKAFKEHNKLNYYPLQWAIMNILLCAAAYQLKDIDILWKAIFTVIVAAVPVFLIARFRNLRTQILH
jgi:O-antigen/teichoic acid export membrane protein